MMSDMQWALAASVLSLTGSAVDSAAPSLQTFGATSPVLRPAQSREIYWSRDINNLQRHWIFKQSDLSAHSTADGHEKLFFFVAQTVTLILQHPKETKGGLNPAPAFTGVQISICAVQRLVHREVLRNMGLTEATTPPTLLLWGAVRSSTLIQNLSSVRPRARQSLWVDKNTYSILWHDKINANITSCWDVNLAPSLKYSSQKLRINFVCDTCKLK